MKKYLLISFLLLSTNFLKGQQTYFPPLNNNLLWDTLSPASLGWCTDKIDTLYDFLQQENTKGFILLKDGYIVLEKYFGTFTKDSLWYWASAGKTITSFLVGKAQEEGFLNINDTTSTYLGSGWTSCTPLQEGNIKIANQLTMTTGLDDGVPDYHCTIDTCLSYLADAGTRWAYHNAPYTLLESVLTNATGSPINTYTQNKLKNATGMNGFWLTVDFDNIYFSTARSMARYGLLAANHFIWDTDTLLYDTAYINQMTNTSQQFNYSYGYLWWLNGKQSYMVPTSQIVFPGSYAPQAPSDMYAGIGKNGQLLSIAPSSGLTFVRMGDSPNSPSSEVSTIFCNQIWQKINAVTCGSTSINEEGNSFPEVTVFPNPVNQMLYINYQSEFFNTELLDQFGRILLSQKGNSEIVSIDVSSIHQGTYVLRISDRFGRMIYSKIILIN